MGLVSGDLVIPILYLSSISERVVYSIDLSVSSTRGIMWRYIQVFIIVYPYKVIKYHHYDSGTGGGSSCMSNKHASIKRCRMLSWNIIYPDTVVPKFNMRWL